MTNPTVLIFGFLLAGLAGAGVAMIASPNADQATEDLSLEVSRLRSQIDDMRQPTAAPSSEDSVLGLEVANLKNRIRMLEASGRPASAAEVGGPAAEGSAAEGEGSLPAAMPEEALAERVKELVAETDRKRWETIGKRFSDFGAQRESSTLDQLAEKHGLSPYQRTQMEEVLARRRKAIGSFFRGMMDRSESAPDFTQIRKKMTDVQAETDEAAKQILNAEQYDSYKEIEASSRRGPPWMGGGGGTPGGR